MNLEEKISSLNQNIFLKEFTYSKNKFSPTPSSEFELADNIIWLRDLLIVFQLAQFFSLYSFPLSYTSPHRFQHS